LFGRLRLHSIERGSIKPLRLTVKALLRLFSEGSIKAHGEGSMKALRLNTQCLALGQAALQLEYACIKALLRLS
jgi:hypothetical protein